MLRAPHPIIDSIPIINPHIANHRCPFRLRLPIIHIGNISPANTATDARLHPPATSVALVCTLIVTFTDPAPGTTCGGEKDTVAPAGNPLALKSTIPVNAPDGAPTVIA
jgi:hypothetical protein